MHCPAPPLPENEDRPKISLLNLLSYDGTEQMLTGLHDSLTHN